MTEYRRRATVHSRRGRRRATGVAGEDEEYDAVRDERQEGRQFPLVIPLEQAGSDDRSRAGGKAANLGAMLRAGLPVPNGFCLTTDALERFLTAAGAAPLCDELRRASTAEVAAAIAARLRAAIAAAAMPAAIEDALVAAWETDLGGAPCAVRSSATAEDLAQASFAGQLETVLNVRRREALLAAVRRCWGSLFSGRAVAYRARAALGDAGIGMAVIVQRFVAADAAGVLFTRNPLAEGADEIVIEGAYGAGEALVSGRVTPDRFVLERGSLRVLRRTVAVKPLALTPDDRGGVAETVVASDRAAAAVLDDAALSRLARLGLAAERLFGAPQDVEWAVAGGDAFVLQSRPVTTRAPAPAEGDGQVWTNMNTGEILPDVVSPLTWSVLQRSLLHLFDRLLVFLGFDLRQAPLVGIIDGRVYFNLNTTMALGRIVGGDSFDITAALGGMHGELDAPAVRARLEQNLPRVRRSLATLLRRVPTLLAWALRHHSRRRSSRELQRIAGRVTDFRRRDLRQLDLAVLSAEVERSVGMITDVMTTVGSVAIINAAYLGVLDAAGRRWFPGEHMANQVLTGIGGMASAEAGLDLWRLAHAAERQPAVARVLRAGEPWAVTRATLAACEGGGAFLARWDEFMTRHGHHARGEVELMNARWADEPDYVLSQVRSYLANRGGKDPVAVHRAQAAECERRVDALCGRLRNPAARAVFRWIVRRAQFGMVYRENAKSEGVRLFAHIRDGARELGARHMSSGRLERADDVFLLRFEELAALGAQTPAAVQALVRERAAELERHRSRQPPPIVCGTAVVERAEMERTGADTDRLTGLGVSAGVASGPARVILRADTEERVLPGEILVAPFTDPGWTPYFQLAAGLVTDLGGMLSHGSIVAREYGLPAVVNVGDATRRIRTGDRLEIDGTRGEVRIVR
jgi:pyruvate,water dikinase